MSKVGAAVEDLRYLLLVSNGVHVSSIMDALDRVYLRMAITPDVNEIPRIVPWWLEKHGLPETSELFEEMETEFGWYEELKWDSINLGGLVDGPDWEDEKEEEGQGGDGDGDGHSHDRPAAVHRYWGQALTREPFVDAARTDWDLAARISPVSEDLTEEEYRGIILCESDFGGTGEWDVLDESDLDSKDEWVEVMEKENWHSIGTETAMLRDMLS
jgi:hypothetical protein